MGDACRGAGTAVSLSVIALLLVTSVLGIVQLSGAVILHEGSTIIVVTGALRLLAYRDDLTEYRANR